MSVYPEPISGGASGPRKRVTGPATAAGEHLPASVWASGFWRQDDATVPAETVTLFPIDFFLEALFPIDNFICKIVDWEKGFQDCQGNEDGGWKKVPHSCPKL